MWEVVVWYDVIVEGDLGDKMWEEFSVIDFSGEIVVLG